MRSAFRPGDQRLLTATLERLKTFERESIDRLSRLEENLRLLRQDIVGDGQPGRLTYLESAVGEMRDEQQRQRGIFTGISFVISTVVTLVSRLLSR